MLLNTSPLCRLPFKAPNRNKASQLRANITAKLTQYVAAEYPCEPDSGTLK
jgi:hypothetical protein